MISRSPKMMNTINIGGSLLIAGDDDGCDDDNDEYKVHGHLSLVIVSVNVYDDSVTKPV